MITGATITARRPGRARIASLLLILAPLFLAGCGTTRSGRAWGEDVTAAPPLDHVRSAAGRAAASPRVWAPLAAAVIFAAARLDHGVSRAAADHTPAFGSHDRAVSASNDLLNAMEIAWIASVVVAPSGDRPVSIAVNKARGFAAELAAVSATKNLTVVLKKAADRTRPNGKPEGFPSAHASSAFVYGSLAERNVNGLRLPAGLRTGLRGGLLAAETATAWARVEARAHYPSDVLFGAAFGTFLANFVTDALSVAPDSSGAGVRFVTDPAAPGVGVQVRFR